jgi:FkbM family methyltransferase
MQTTAEVRLSIGTKAYRIHSDDTYLRAMRRGTLHSIEAAVRRAVGANRFEPRMARLYSTLVRPQDVVLDVGANIGCTSILFAQLARRVVAFEPVPKTFAHWQRNIQASGHANCFGMNVALGDENKTSQINYTESNRSGAFVSDSVVGAGESASIEVRRLDDLLARLDLPAVDFVKIDVEGYERKVIEGGWSTIAANRCLVQLELNAWCLNAMHRTSLPDFLDFLLDRFPLVYCVEKSSYADLRKIQARWFVMHKNIIEQRFKEMVVGFDASRLGRFYSQYTEIG